MLPVEAIMRLLLILVALFALPVCAQGVVTYPAHTAAPDYCWVFELHLDHGATPVAANITVSLTTNSTNGLRARLVDVHGHANQLPQAEAMGTRSGWGSLVFNFQTAVRTGNHPLLLIFQPLTPGGPSDCAGTVSSDTGTLTGGGKQHARSIEYNGLFMPMGYYVSFRDVFTTQAVYSTTVELDFGATPRALTFNFEGSGSGLDEIRVYDVTGGNVLLNTLNAAPSGALATSSLTTTPSYSGTVQLRVEVQGDGSMGDVFWALWLQDGVVVTGATGDGVPSVGNPGGSKGGGGGGGCTSGESRIIAPLLAAAVLLLRRRRK